MLTDAITRNALAAALAAACAVAGVQTWRLHSARADLAQERAESAARQMAAERALNAAIASAQATHDRWETQLAQEQTNAQSQIDRARADAAGALSAAAGLRDAARSASSRCAGTQAAAAAASGTPAASAGMVLADVLAELAEQGAAMAAEADRRGIAGAACERAYEVVATP